MKKLLYIAIVSLAFVYSSFGATFYSVTSGDPNVLANWNTARDGSGLAAANFTTLGDVFTIQNTHVMTNVAPWTLGVLLSAPVALTIENGGTLKADFQVVIANTGATFTMESGSTFIQNNTASMSSGIFNGLEQLDINSNFEVRVANTAYPAGSVISSGGYGNFIVNLTATSTTAVATNGAVIVKGNMIVKSTGTQPFAVGNINNTLLTVNGNYTHTSGTFRITTGGGTNIALQVNGNFNLSGGTFDTCGTTGSIACSSTAYGILRVKGNFEVSGSVTSIGRSGSSSDNFVVLNGTTQNFTVPASFAFGSGVSFIIAATSTTTLQSNLTTGSFTQPGITVLGTLNTNAKTISAGKIFVACRVISPCNNGSGEALGSTGILNLAGGSVSLTNSNTMEVYAGGTLNATGSTINYNNSSLSGMTVSGVANLTDTMFKSAGATLAPITINGFLGGFGTVNVRGASTVSISGITAAAGAKFNWTDAGSLTSNRNNLITSGTLTLGTGGILNNGTFVMNGTDSFCGQADSLLIRSSVAGTARPWSGSGVFTLTDIDVQDQNSTPAITVVSGTDSGNNTSFTFALCPPTAALASVRGRLLTSTGRGLINASVILTNTNTGEFKIVRSTSLGYFNFQELAVGNVYVVSVKSKRFIFANHTFTLNEDLTDLVLTAQASDSKQ
jgi:hypothetical protein